MDLNRQQALAPTHRVFLQDAQRGLCLADEHSCVSAVQERSVSELGEGWAQVKLGRPAIHRRVQQGSPSIIIQLPDATPPSRRISACSESCRAGARAGARRAAKLRGPTRCRWLVTFRSRARGWPHLDDARVERHVKLARKRPLAVRWGHERAGTAIGCCGLGNYKSLLPGALRARARRGQTHGDLHSHHNCRYAPILALEALGEVKSGERRRQATTTCNCPRVAHGRGGGRAGQTTMRWTRIATRTEGREVA